MSTPDIRVRLSPEGVKEVVAALRQIQEEAKKANKGAGDGVNVVKNALSELKSLLPTIGLAATVAGFGALSAQALETADATGKLQQRVGGTVEDISALTLAFRTNQSDQQGLQTALQKTAVVIGEVKGGSVQAIEALHAIGVNAGNLANLDTPRALEEIAKKLAAIPPGAERAAAAQKIFGKASGDLTVALDALGKDGIDAFKKRAQELGVLIDTDLAAAAARANDALQIVKIQAEGLATQFVAGLAPAIADAMETFSTAVTGDGINGIRQFGQAVGFVVRAVIDLFVAMGKVIGSRIAQLGVLIETTVEASKAAASGNFAGAKEAFASGARQLDNINQERKADLEKLGADLLAGPKKVDGKPSQAAASVLPVVGDDAKKAAEARQAFLKASLQAELKIQQEQLKSQEQANKAALDQGLISLKEFYDKRREIVSRGTKAETDALKIERSGVAKQLQAELTKRALIEKQVGGTTANTGQGQQPIKVGNEETVLKLRQQLATLNADIRAKEISSAREIEQINNEEFNQTKRQKEELAQLAGHLDDLEGKRHAAFEANLDQEIQQIRELGARSGQTADEIEANVQRLINARTNQFDFAEVTRTAEASMASFNEAAQRIRADMEAGILSQVEGEQRLIELEGQRIEQLKELAKQLKAAADQTGDEDQIRKAQDFSASVDQIAVSYKNASEFGAKFRATGVDAFEAGVASLLQNADKIKSVGDAFRSLAQTVAAALAKIAAEILAKQATIALTKAITSALASGAQTGGYVRGYATGGDIAGRPLAIPGADNIPILAQKGEFMMRRARVQEPGALDFLRRWNSGRFTLAEAMRVPKFATGGEIGAPQATPGQAPPAGAKGASQPSQSVRIINVLDPSIVSDALASASGEQTLLNVIERNSTNIRRKLGM